MQSNGQLGRGLRRSSEKTLMRVFYILTCEGLTTFPKVRRTYLFCVVLEDALWPFRRRCVLWTCTSVLFHFCRMDRRIVLPNSSPSHINKV